MLGRYRNFIRRGAVAGIVIGALLVSLINLAGGTRPAAASGERDCEPTAVIMCGALTVDELQKEYAAGGTKVHYGDIATIYAAFGISATDIQGMNGHFQMGQVKADGNVFVNGVQIGSGAITAGRVKTANSEAIAGTTAFKRPPSDSFAHPDTVIDAFVVYDTNNQPSFAILASCGNPVTWNLPSVSVEKKVQDPSSGQFVKDASFANNSTATYQVTVTNAGKGADSNIKLSDALPEHQAYVPGSTTNNGAAAPDGIAGDPFVIDALQPGQTAVILYKAMILVPPTTCGKTDMVNTITMSSDHVPNQQASASTHVNILCVTAKCISLTSSADTVQSGQTLVLTAQASAVNTTVKTYDFRVDGQIAQTSPSSSFTFTADQAGTHTISVITVFNDGTNDGGGGVCAKTVTVTSPAKPTVLPSTGGGAFMAFMGTSAIGTGAHQFIKRRRR